MTALLQMLLLALLLDVDRRRILRASLQNLALSMVVKESVAEPDAAHSLELPEKQCRREAPLLSCLLDPSAADNTDVTV